jgi:hypothetical protein
MQICVWHSHFVRIMQTVAARQTNAVVKATCTTLCSAEVVSYVCRVECVWLL